MLVMQWSGRLQGLCVCLCAGSAMRWECVQSARRILIWVGMVYLLTVVSCTWIVVVGGRLMSGAGHLIAYLSALFVGLGLSGLPVFVCNKMVHDLEIE